MTHDIGDVTVLEIHFCYLRKNIEYLLYLHADRTFSVARLSLLPPVVQTLHMATVQINVRLLSGKTVVGGDPSRYYQRVQSHGTLGPSGIQLVDHVLQMLLALKDKLTLEEKTSLMLGLQEPIKVLQSRDEL